ncbi:hypothetical protein [Lysinibacillus xylanilyticus]|uniref:hypothetical protein n=1 Tax=Lysinibacillus xylanilyticus TaxID=582475 RepID=UPI003D00FA7B
MDNFLLEKMKAESIFRLEQLGIDKDIVATMKNSNDEIYDEIFVNEVFNVEYVGLVPKIVKYKVDDLPEQTVLKNREGEWDCLPYFGINHGGLCIFYVTSNEEEWEFDRDSIDENYQSAYVYNELYPDLSEFGDIFFEKTPRGGLIRIG